MSKNLKGLVLVLLGTEYDFWKTNRAEKEWRPIKSYWAQCSLNTAGRWYEGIELVLTRDMKLETSQIFLRKEVISVASLHKFFCYKWISGHKLSHWLGFWAWWILKADASGIWWSSEEHRKGVLVENTHAFLFLASLRSSAVHKAF